MSRVAPEHRRDQARSADGYLPIEHHGIIGDLHSVALVGNEGTIDWFCPDRFDAPSLFASLLDNEIGGHFAIQPTDDSYTTKQLYLPGTAVLVTRFFTDSGVGEIVDYMPVESASCTIVRRLEVVRGSLRFRMMCAPAFDYARTPHTLELRDGMATFTGGEHACELRASGAQFEAAEGNVVVSEVTLQRGERAAFVLSGGRHDVTWDQEAVERSFAETVTFWRNWIGQSRYRGRWREMVDRSAITLKLLTYEPTGAVVAAPTTSLPEHIGGPRNWDCRYCWLRDSAFTMFGFLRLGCRA